MEQQLTALNEAFLDKKDEPENSQDQSVSLCFSSKNTYISILLSESNAFLFRKIILFSTTIKISVGITITLIFLSILTIILGFNFIPTTVRTIILIVAFGYYFLYSFCLCLLLNYNAMKYVIKTFDFWIKLLYSIRMSIALVIDHRNATFVNFLLSITWISWTIVIASFDALNYSYKFKQIISMIAGLILLYFVLKISFGFTDDSRIYEINLIGNFCYTYDTKNEINSSLQILVIFFLRQSFFLCWYKENNCSLLSRKRVIKWVN